MDISISYYTAKGKRQNNEDSVSLLEGSNTLLAIVADGLGGLDDGELASRQAVSSINAQLQSAAPQEDLLVDAIRQASRDIYRIQPRGKTMRTTVAALWIGDYAVMAANVGDSRIYQFRGDRILYQSMDHSVAQMAVLVGELEQSQIRQSRDRNKLVRALGDQEPPRVDSEQLTVRNGDRFLLCSDGFWETVTEEDMLHTMASSATAREWLGQMRQLVENANVAGQDNHTAIAIIVNEIPMGG